jgi:hypothetical protein
MPSGLVHPSVFESWFGLQLLPKLLGERSSLLRPAMILSRSVLKHGYAPLRVALYGDQRLNRIAIRVEIRFAWQHHPGDRAQNGNLRIQKLHVANPTHERTRVMVVKDLPVNRGNLRAPLQLRTVEPDGNPILVKQVCDGIGIPPVPTTQDLSV